MHSNLWSGIRGTGHIKFKDLSLERLIATSIRSSCPVILSWYVEVEETIRGRNNQWVTKQMFGVPRYFFRFGYTEACIDQAFVCIDVLPMGCPITDGKSCF